MTPSRADSQIPGRAAALALLLLLGACRNEAPAAAPAAEVTTSPDSMVAVRMLPHTAAYELIDSLPRDPATAPLPADEYTAAQIRLGAQIVMDTRAHAGAYAGNDLSCANCHLNGGQRERALPYVGVAATFPQYRSRDGRLISLEDRIADCFRRSINGTAPPFDSPEMMAVAAYITWLSEGLAIGSDPAWRGLNRIAKEQQIPIAQLDVTAGERLYTQHCVACHGADGQGVTLGTRNPGPLWGPRSWNDGAGAARIYTLAGYIRYAMPLTAPGTLSDADAQHIAAFINAHERPAFAGKADDFPNGDVPIDAVYYPQRYAQHPLRAR